MSFLSERSAALGGKPYTPGAILPPTVAFVTETYPPELNGVALTAERAVCYLRARGYRVELVRPRQTIDAGRAPAGDEMLVRGVPLPRYRGLQLGLPATLRMIRRWRADRPDIVHVATEGPLGWSALVAARSLGIPVTSDYRTHFQRYSGYYGFGTLARSIDAYLRAFHNRTDATFVATDALARELRANGYGNTLCIGRGVDTEMFSPARRSAALRMQWGVGHDGLAALYVGRLAPEKNPELVVQAFAALRGRYPRARLIWVGDGPQRAALERQADVQVFAGVQRGRALAEHYASADLFLFPSLTDTFGNVTLEAMASGLPIVAFNAAAAAQHLRDGESARLVTPDDAQAYVAAAVALAAAPDLRRALGAEARRIAETLAWPKVLRVFERRLLTCALQGRIPQPSYGTRQP